MTKRLLKMFLLLLMSTALLLGCGGSKSSESEESSDKTKENNKVGVSMPTSELQRWNQDGSNIQKQLEEEGYEVDLQYADNTADTQTSQIEEMVDAGVKVLVIAPVDGDSLRDVLEKAKKAGISVISYDRLILDSDAVSYYATFDNYMVGTKQGEYIRDQLDLDHAEGPFYIEIFAGDAADNNAGFFYRGAMDILEPYIDSGKLVVKSGQVDFGVAAIVNWLTETAQSRMDGLISDYYSDGTSLDAVLCSNDSTALGVINSLEANYTGEWPIITGQDCDIANVKKLIEGKQSMSIFKDTRTLASQTVNMVYAIMNGLSAPVNDTETYDNGTGVISSYLCEPVFVDVDNYKELLIDSGYYEETELQ